MIQLLPSVGGILLALSLARRWPDRISRDPDGSVAMYYFGSAGHGRIVVDLGGEIVASVAGEVWSVDPWPRSIVDAADRICAAVKPPSAEPAPTRPPGRSR